jgi:sulfatase modifying factor 1
LQFLNSVDATGNKTNGIYNKFMGTDARGGISFNSGAATGSKYAVKTNMGNKPLNFVSWFDAARVSNWLHNGATSTSSMETGAYTLNNATSGNAVEMIAGARFFIPSENQWYKAAYYKGGSTNEYWAYGTKSSTLPTSVTAGGTGDGSPGTGSSANSANYNSAADWGSPLQTGNVTTVGTNGGPSAYGAFDMTGNVREWNDLDRSNFSTRGIRGGEWLNNSNFLSSSHRINNGPTAESRLVGFRVASLSSSAAAVPEASMMVIGTLFGLGGLMAKRRMKK